MRIRNNSKVFKPSKAMGQNFLTDENIACKIVRLSGVGKNCGVLEVGPGLGALTSKLAEVAGHVTAVELDARLSDELSEKLSSHPNVQLIQGDIMKTEIAMLVSKTMPETELHVCANLPYNITTPCIAHLIESNTFQIITVMVQKEVAQRMCAGPGTPEYGAFSVFIGYHSKPEILFDVPPSSFTPRPKVTSSVIKLELRKERLLDKQDERLFFRVVKAAFAQRRKTLVNALHAAFAGIHSKEALTEAVEQCGFDAKIRGEMLGVNGFIELSARLGR